MTFASRTHQLKPEGAYQVLARAQAMQAAGQDVIHLEIGEPDFSTPANIVGAAFAAIDAGHTHYTPTAGVPALREIIAEQAGRQRGIRLSPAQVIVSPGAKPNLFFPTLALVESGDEVMYPDPGFPTYRMMIEIAGGIPIPMPLLESNGFSIDLDDFDRRVSPRTKLIILNSPGNPTGAVFPRSDLEHIAARAQEHGAWVLTDEIYSRITFDGRSAPSIASLPGMAERTIIMDGFSKTYAMTGWRLGFGIMPEPLAERVTLLLTHSIGCTAHFTQIAGIEALTGQQESVDQMVGEFERRRDLIVAGLNHLPGVHCLVPQGAFYAFPNVAALGLPAAELADRFLEAGVALLPGTAFGQHGEGYLRLAFTNSADNIERALGRIREAIQSLS